MSIENVTFTAGQAAHQAGISRKALRVYLERELLAETERTSAGYRLYTRSDVAVLCFIRQARTLGLHLDDIADILAIHRGGGPPCAAVVDLIDTRITEIDTAIADLRALRATLTRARAAAPAVCPPGNSDQQASVCAIVEHADPAWPCANGSPSQPGMVATGWSTSACSRAAPMGASATRGNTTRRSARVVATSVR